MYLDTALSKSNFQLIATNSKNKKRVLPWTVQLPAALSDDALQGYHNIV